LYSGIVVTPLVTICPEPESAFQSCTSSRTCRLSAKLGSRWTMPALFEASMLTAGESVTIA
jgi:hypothetical protein